MRDEVRRAEQQLKELKVRMEINKSYKPRTRRYIRGQGIGLSKEEKTLKKLIESKERYIDNLYSVWLTGRDDVDV